MSKTLRLLGALAVATATVPFLGVPAAHADEVKIAPSTSGYFYAEGIRKPDDFPAPIPNVTGAAADRVAPGNLAVAAQANKEDKVSFLLFDLLEIVPGSMVTKATLTLPLVPNDADNASYGHAPEKVRACMAGPEGFNGDDAASMQDAPARKCDKFSSAGKASADGKAYTFDITKLAQTWVDAENDGVALTANEGAASTPFQVVFAAAEKASLALTFTPGAEDEVVVPPVSVPDTGSTDAGGGFSGEVLPPPTDTGSLGSVSTPTLPEPAPAPAAVAPPVAAPQAAAPATAVPVSLETLQPTTAFWLGGLLLAAVLVLLSLIMGDPTVPAATQRPSRLSKALSARQRGTAGARPSFSRPIAI